MSKLSHPHIPLKIQVAIYFQDKWLCQYCYRPVILAVALQCFARLVRTSRVANVEPAYWHPHWPRCQAPLLDELGATIDHKIALKNGGLNDSSNFVTACARCNARKSAKGEAEFRKELMPWRVEGKDGDPTAWDGFALVFLALAEQFPDQLTANECKWVEAIRGHMKPTIPQAKGVGVDAICQP
jgi:5-methylcytosine-specific restriction endonuclease McrA